MNDALLLWPLTYLVHSTLLLAAAWLASRWIRPAAWSEALWRCAFYGAFLTASLQPVLQVAPASTATRAPADVASRPDAVPAAPAIAPVRAPSGDPQRVAADPAAPVPVRADASVPVDAWRWWLPPQTRLVLLAALLAWAAVAAAGLALLLVQWAALARACRRLRPNVDGAWATALRELARHYGLKRTPVLKVGAAWGSPLVGPRGVVCLPDWCLAQLHGTQRDAVLAHELAHLSRRDPGWRLASRVAACVGWMQPLNALALRRLDALAEQACDAKAARAIADRQAVAEALYACASQLRAGRRTPRLQVGMASTRSPLVARIEQLMRHDPAQPTRAVPRRMWAFVAIALAGIACLLPALKVRGDALRSTEWRDFVAEVLPSPGPRTHVVTRSPGDDIDLWIRGHATLRDDSDELRSGQVSLRETTGGSTRRLDIDADAGATPVVAYQLNGEPHPLDADAKQWVERRWSLVVGTLLNPAQRVERLLARGGPETLMRAIEKPVDIETQRTLIEAYAGNRSLDEETVQRLIVAADRAEPGGDDHDRLLSLRNIANRQQLTADQKQAYLAALAARATDSESAGALQALLVQLGANTQAATLATAATALRALPSDNARREVLDNALDRGAATAADLALQVTPAFTSDYDHRELLEHVARRLAATKNAELAQRYADSARQLKAPFERRTALLALIESTPLNQDGCMAVLNALEGIDSASDLTPVLIALARRMPSDSGLIARYRQIARVLPTYERGQAEQALDAFPSSS
jgi:beta-lactamase regulating signal transducer with metallopeptidase domain